VSIADDGSILQMVSFLRGAWHAGSDTASPIRVGRARFAANRCAASIELLGREPGPWPAAQVAGAKRVARALVRAYGITPQLSRMTHAAIDPKRRTDPGEPWLRDHHDDVIRYAHG
jgi:N-acetyl-anhydromuramyl-L-alanine amidase AmpD